MQTQKKGFEIYRQGNQKQKFGQGSSYLMACYGEASKVMLWNQAAVSAGGNKTVEGNWDSETCMDSVEDVSDGQDQFSISKSLN